MTQMEPGVKCDAGLKSQDIGCNWFVLENMTVQVDENEMERVVLLKTIDVKNIVLKNVYLKTDSPCTCSLEDFLDIEPKTNFIKTYSLFG